MKEKFPPLNVEVIVARHVAALAKQQQQQQDSSQSQQQQGTSTGTSSSQDETTTTSATASSPRSAVTTSPRGGGKKSSTAADLQFVLRRTISSTARNEATEAERQQLIAASSSQQQQRASSSCSGGTDTTCPAYFEKLHTTVRGIPDPPAVSRTVEETNRRKDYAERHGGVAIAATIADEEANKRFFEQEMLQRKLKQTQQAAAEVEAVRKFRGEKMALNKQEQQVRRLADEGLEQKNSSREALREEYFRKYAAVNVTPRRHESREAKKKA